MGYRYYYSVKRNVLFPFGHGLSYTTFDYSALSIAVQKPSADSMFVSVNVTVKNNGKYKGNEVIQLYVHDNKPDVQRPEQELKGFVKIESDPGKSGTVSFKLDFRSFAWFDAPDGIWRPLHWWETHEWAKRKTNQHLAEISSGFRIY